MGFGAKPCISPASNIPRTFPVGRVRPARVRDDMTASLARTRPAREARGAPARGELEPRVHRLENGF